MANRVIAPNSVNLSGADVFPTGTPQYFTAGNPSSAIPATVLPGAWTNMVQDELLNPVIQSGITPDGNNWLQLLYSMYRATTMFDVSVTPNTITFAPTIPIPAGIITTGFSFVGKVANTNTSITVNATISGGSSIPVVSGDGNLPQPGDFIPGAFYRFGYDGTRLRVSPAYTTYRPIPLAGIQVFVRTDGNDSNNGFTNTAGGAYLTINGAINGVSNQFNLPANRLLTITLGIAGTYSTTGIVTPPSSNITITGATGTASLYIISGGAAQDIVTAEFGANLTLQNLTVQQTSNTHNWVSAAFSGILTVSNVTFTQTFGGSQAFAVINAFPGGTINVFSVSMQGVNCGVGYNAHGTGNMTISGNNASVLTFGSCTFGNGVLNASDLGYIILGILTSSGTPTGQRYLVNNNAVINSEAQGINIIPGTVAGATSNGGIYVP